MNYSELCDHISQTIVTAIDSGETGRWAAPWHRIFAGWAPRNAKTDQFYRGSNIMNLAVASLERAEANPDEPTSPIWSTDKQWADIGAQVRKGEQSSPIVKWVPKSKKTNDHETPPPTTPDGQPLTRLGGPQLVPRSHTDSITPATRCLPTGSNLLASVSTKIRSITTRRCATNSSTGHSSQPAVTVSSAHASVMTRTRSRN